MWIGIGRITLDFYNNQDLKLKKKQMDALSRELRREFNISAIEVASSDDPEKGVLGFSQVFSDTMKSVRAEQALERICQLIDCTAPARVVLEERELFRYGH